MEAFLALEQQAKAEAAVGGGARDAVTSELRGAFDSLPRDLQAALLLTPGREELLQRGGDE